MCAWLRGFFDGEGCVSFIPKGGKHRQTYCRLYVGNTDPSLIATCRRYFEAIGIEYSFRVRKCEPPRKPLALIYVSKHASLLRFAKTVGFASDAKRSTMEALVAYIESRGPMYSKQLMRDLYVRQKMSLPEICRHFGKHSRQQWYFSKLLRDYGIPLRSKSDAVKIALKKRAKAASSQSVAQVPEIAISQ